MSRECLLSIPRSLTLSNIKLASTCSVIVISLLLNDSMYFSYFWSCDSFLGITTRIYTYSRSCLNYTLSLSLFFRDYFLRRTFFYRLRDLNKWGNTSKNSINRRWIALPALSFWWLFEFLPHFPYPFVWIFQLFWAFHLLMHRSNLLLRY